MVSSRRRGRAAMLICLLLGLTMTACAAGTTTAGALPTPSVVAPHDVATISIVPVTTPTLPATPRAAPAVPTAVAPSTGTVVAAPSPTLVAVPTSISGEHVPISREGEDACDSAAAHDAGTSEQATADEEVGSDGRAA